MFTLRSDKSNRKRNIGKFIGDTLHLPPALLNSANLMPERDVIPN